MGYYIRTTITIDPKGEWFKDSYLNWQDVYCTKIRELMITFFKTNKAPGGFISDDNIGQQDLIAPFVQAIGYENNSKIVFAGEFKWWGLGDAYDLARFLSKKLKTSVDMISIGEDGASMVDSFYEGRSKQEQSIDLGDAICGSEVLISTEAQVIDGCVYLNKSYAPRKPDKVITKKTVKAKDREDKEFTVEIEPSDIGFEL